MAAWEKETLVNDGIVNLELGISGTATIALTNVDRPLTATEGLAFVLILTGTVTADVAVIVPQESRVYIVDNRCTVPGSHSITVRPPVGGGMTVESGGHRAVVYCDGSDVYPVASGTGGSGGGSGAPTDAPYLVSAAHSLLTSERLVTDSPTITWDFATPGAARAVIPPDAITYSHLQNVTSSRILGRFTGGAGDAEEVTLGTGLTLDAGGVLSATAVGQPLDATLTALAELPTGANLLPYFTGVDTVTTTTLSAFLRTLLDDPDAATARSTLEAQANDATLTALAGVTTGADTLPFFTGTDTASTTVLTAFMRSLLDDPDAATARSTLGVTGGGLDTEGVQDIVGAMATDSATIDYTYDDTAGTFTSSVKDGSVTVAKLQTIPASRLLGRGTAGTGAVEVIQVSGAGFQLTGPVLTLDVALDAIATANPTANTLVYFTGTNTAALQALTAAGRALLDDADSTAQRTTLGLGTMAQQDANAVAITGGTATLSTAMISDGLSIGTTTPDPGILTTIRYLKAGQFAVVIIPKDNDTGPGNPFIFKNVGGSTIGTIACNASTTAYTTSSDVRLKHSIAPLTGSLAVIAALNPVAFRWNATDESDIGFLAHELQVIVPTAVTGQPDEINEDGTIRPQQVDHSRLVPLLTAALKELLARVEVLEQALA